MLLVCFKPKNELSGTLVNVYNFGDVRAEITYTPIKGKSSVTATHDQRTDVLKGVCD
jgi:hypothetical protein